jgi:Sputnik virophage major capsid protein 1st domain
MSSADYTTKLVRDSRLNDVTNQLDVPVSQGAAQSTYQQYVATSSSTSNLSWNIQPPSESVVIDRNVLMSARVKFSLNIGPNVSPGVNVFQYGLREAFQAFPLNSLFTTCTATINNTSVSINLQDVFPALLHTMEEDDLQHYKGMSPSLIDRYQNFSDGVNANNNPMQTLRMQGTTIIFYQEDATHCIV